MANTRQPAHSHPNLRRALAREIASTVGLLADEHDFRGNAAVPDLRLRGPHRLPPAGRSSPQEPRGPGQPHHRRALRPRGVRRILRRDRAGPRRPTSRSRFTADLAATGPPVAYDRAAPRDLLPDLGRRGRPPRDLGVRHHRPRRPRATAPPAARRSARPPSRGPPDSSPNSPSTPRAPAPTTSSAASGPPTTSPSRSSTPMAPRGPGPPSTTRRPRESTAVLAAGIALGAPGGIVLRTTTPGTADRLHGWRLHEGSLLSRSPRPRSSAPTAPTPTPESRCPPEPGVEYCAGFALTTDDPDSHH